MNIASLLYEYFKRKIECMFYLILRFILYSFFETSLVSAVEQFSFSSVLVSNRKLEIMYIPVSSAPEKAS